MKSKDRLDDIEGETPLGKEAADRYRANTMRAQYLSSDMIPTMRSTCTSVSSVITTCASVLETGTDIQCARSLRHFSHFTSAPTARSAAVGSARDATTDPGSAETAVSSSDGNSE